MHVFGKARFATVFALFSSPDDAPKNAKVGSDGFARGMQWVIGVGFNAHTFVPAAQKALPILIKS